MEAPANDPSGEAMERWRSAAAKTVGAAAESLISLTAGGAVIAPLYPRPRDVAAQPWRGAAGWAVSARIEHPEPAAANAQALVDLAGGADALALVTADSPFSRGFGLPGAPADLADALEGVELDLIALRLDAGGPAAIAALADIAARRRLDAAGLIIDGGCDPIGAAVCAGTPPALGDLAAAVEAARRGGFAGCPLLADGRPYHEAGAGEADELAAVLATAVAYLRALAAGGMALDAARDAIGMLLPVDADLLPGISKLRALRRLWARVEESCRLDLRPLRLHAETSWRCMTRRAPHTNALRAALGCAAAGLGGADTVTVLPMTAVAALPEAAARRLARNTGRLLIDEAHLAKVDDPAGGSGAIEALTATLCEGAWETFQRIEAAGGLPAAGGILRERIAASAARRAAAAAHGTQPIVGTSLYPALDAAEPTPRMRPRAASAPAATALPRRRDAEPFEALRDRGEAAGCPTVLIAALGEPAGYGARASFAANLFAAAGLAATAPMPADDDIAASCRDGTARVACICGSDDSYRAHATGLVHALREAGIGRVLLAGSASQWQETGADAFVHEGCAALDILRDLLDAAIPPPD